MTNDRRKDKTRQIIEAAGIKCFAKNGFTSVTVEDIALEAELTKRTVYNYFPTKSAIIASIFEKKLEELYLLEFHSFQDCHTQVEVIKTLFSVLHSFTTENLGFMEMFWSLKDSSPEVIPPDILERIAELNKKLIDLPSSALREAQPAGAGLKYKPDIIVHCISAINKGLSMQIKQDTALLLTQDDVEDLVELMRSLTLSVLPQSPPADAAE